MQNFKETKNKLYIESLNVNKKTNEMELEFRSNKFK